MSSDYLRGLILLMLMFGIVLYLLGDPIGYLLFGIPMFHFSPVRTTEQVIGTILSYSVRPVQLFGVTLFACAVLVWNRLRYGA